MILEINYSVATNKGGKNKNQDAFLIGKNSLKENDIFTENKACYGTCDTQELKLFAVCDGVGNFFNSEYSADFAIRYLSNELKKYDASVPLDEWLVNIVEKSHKNMKQYMLDNIILGGTTLTLIAIKDNEYCLINIGDSPAYLISNEVIKELSRPQTLAEYKLTQKIKPEPEDYHVLMFCLGYSNESVKEMAYLTTGFLNQDDKIVLCTDGVTDLFNQKSILEKVEKNKDAKYFVDNASDSEDSDNCTAIIINVINTVI